MASARASVPDGDRRPGAVAAGTRRALTAAAAGVVTYGYDDVNTGATPLNVDGTYNLPGAVFTNPPEPNEIKVNAGGLSVALVCTMAVDSGGPDGVGVPDQSSPTPTASLNTFNIQVP